MKTALITEVSGQDGAYLVLLRLDKGYKVYGAYRRTSSVNFSWMQDLGVAEHPNLELVEYNLTDPGCSLRRIQKFQSDEVHNLAAQSFVGVSFEQPVTTTAEITGVGQSENFLIPKIVAHLRRGEQMIDLGNTDVAMVAKATRGIAANALDALRFDHDALGRQAAFPQPLNLIPFFLLTFSSL